MTKHCSGCDTDKPRTEFYKDSQSRTGLASYCKPCSHGAVQRFYKTNPGKARKKAREWSRTNLERRMLIAARSRARAQGIEFSLELSDIVIPEFCPVLAVRLERGSSQRTPNSPSLDKVDPARGYVKGNVRVISYRANAIKNDATVEELLAVVSYIHEHRQAPRITKRPDELGA